MTDKQSHFLVGLGIVLIFGILNPVCAMLLCIGVVAAKELVWDLAVENGTPEWMDFGATVAGGLIGLLFHALI